jgi:hypothetical protein
MTSRGRTRGGFSVLKTWPSRHDDTRVNLSHPTATLDVAVVAPIPNGALNTIRVQMAARMAK